MDMVASYTSSLLVEEKHLAMTVGSGDLPVLATPVMAMLMENAAMKAVVPHLAEGESTVGAKLDISHLRPTSLGDTIKATATLEASEGRKLTFSVMAEDSKGVIGEGSHVRYVVDKERFLGKITR